MKTKNVQCALETNSREVYYKYFTVWKSLKINT